MELNEGLGVSSEGAPAAAPAPAPAPAPQPAPVPQAPAAPASGQVQPGPASDAQSQSQAPAQQWQGVRDFARAQGVELPYEDDGAALSSLLQAHRQMQERSYYADVGRRMAPHADQFRKYVEAQRAQAQQAPASAWKPPEYRKEWLQQVERDPETGLLRAKAGYDPALADKVQAYADWREKFLDNPEQVVAPLVEQRASALVEAKFAEYQQRSQADQLVAGHARWMFAQGQNGQRQLTPEGLLYAQAARGLWDSGLRDVRVLDAAATAAVENLVLRRHLQAGGGGAPAATTTNGTAAPAVGGAAARPAAGLPSAPATHAPGTALPSLRDRLTSALQGMPEDVSLGR